MYRIPKANELFTIVDLQRANPAVPAYPFQGASCGMCIDLSNPACSCTNLFTQFTATTSLLVPENVWTVRFADGELQTFAKQDGLWVRAVRGP